MIIGICELLRNCTNVVKAVSLRQFRILSIPHLSVWNIHMKNYLRIILLLSSIPVFSASEQSMWMEPSSILNQYHLKMAAQGIIQSNGTTNDPRYGFAKIKQEAENVEHTRYNLTYKNTPVWGHQIIIHKRRNKKPLLTGVLVNGIEIKS